MFNHRLKFLFPGILGLYSFLNILLLDGDRLYQAELPVNVAFILIACIVYSVWLSNAWIEKYVPKLSRKIHPLFIQFGLSLVAVTIISLLSVLITGYWLGGPFSYSSQNFLLTSAFGFRINLFLNTLNAIYFFFKKFKAKELEAEKLKTLNANAKLATINNQINPHFFFNNLSALSNLMHEDIDKADLYLLKLSNIYRYILKNNTQELTTLEKELNFLKDYIDLLSMRFQDALIFKKEINSSFLQYQIPPAVLQLLVENVVKHNIFTVQHPMEVSLVIEGNKCIIKNELRKKEDKSYSTGVGIQNIIDRYKFLGKKIEVIQTSDFFQVNLPLIDPNENTGSRRRTIDLSAN
jgi:two-component system LytT family sensor kinase